jgi:hypothetical protein
MMMFGGSRAEIHPYRGLIAAGPYSEPLERYEEVAILHTRQYSDLANRLLSLLRNGTSPQFPKGFGSIFHSDIKFSLYEVPSSQDEEEIPNILYQKFVENGITHRLPLLVIEKTPKGMFPSVYYDTKSLFTANGLISQIATVQMLENENTLKWSAFPLAMQLFTKMGGLPYVLLEELGGTGEKSLTFIAGVGLSRLTSKEGVGSAYVGFALLFGPNGEWKIMQSKARDYDRSQLVQIFKDLVINLASTVFTKYVSEKEVDAINLIIHYTGKNVSGEEERALWAASSQVTQVYNKEVRISIVKINDSSYQAATNQSPCVSRGGTTTGLVNVGTTLEIKTGFFMLFTVGCLNVGDRFRPSMTGASSPSPILISLKDIGKRSLDNLTLVRSVFDFCRMNYSSLNNPVNRMPITVSYAKEIAYMMGKLELKEIPQSLATRLWFI